MASAASPLSWATLLSADSSSAVKAVDVEAFLVDGGVHVAARQLQHFDLHSRTPAVLHSALANLSRNKEKTHENDEPKPVCPSLSPLARTALLVTTGMSAFSEQEPDESIEEMLSESLTGETLIEEDETLVVFERDALTIMQKRLKKRLKERLRFFYMKYDATKLYKIKELTAKCEGKEGPRGEDALFRALVGKYGPEPEHIFRFVLKTYDPRESGSYVTESLDEIWTAMERLAVSVNGTLKLLIPCRQTRSPYRLHLLVLAGHYGAPVDEAVVQEMQNLIHNRYRILDGQRTGLLLGACGGDLPEHERRRLEKEKSRLKSDRGRRGGGRGLTRR